MAYQTIPNTFASGSVIRSTAVSANMVAVLQGYTTGSYDLWGADVKAKTLNVNSAAASIGSAGTAVFGKTTVTTLSVSSDAAVGGTVTVTGDAYTIAPTAYTPAFLNSIITVNTAATGLYWTVGKTVHFMATIQGTSTGNDHEAISLPVTAATLIQFTDTPCSIQSGAAMTVGVSRVTSDEAYAVILNSDTSFVSGITYRVSIQGTYRGV